MAGEAAGAAVTKIIAWTPPPHSTAQLPDGRWVRVTVSSRHTTAVAGTAFRSPDDADAAPDGVTFVPAGATSPVELSFPQARGKKPTVVRFEVKQREELQSQTVVRVATTQTTDIGRVKVGKASLWVNVAISDDADDPDSGQGRAWASRSDAVYAPTTAVVVPRRPGVYPVAAIADDDRVVVFRVEVAEALADPDVAARQVAAAAEVAGDAMVPMGGIPIVPASPRMDRRAT